MADHNKNSDDNKTSGRGTLKDGISQNDSSQMGSIGSSTGSLDPKSTDSGAAAYGGLHPGQMETDATDQRRIEGTEGPPLANEEDSDTERGPFDFGGLPNRNLKKNLGCG